MYTRTIPLISCQTEKEKYTLYTITYVILSMHAFCHTLVENLLKGPVTSDTNAQLVIQLPIFKSMPNHSVAPSFSKNI